MAKSVRDAMTEEPRSRKYSANGSQLRDESQAP